MICFCSVCFAESISILHVKIGRTVQKLFKGEDFWKFPDCSPKKGFAKILMTRRVSASLAESIGVLQKRIG
jgi:hypothetical protein